MYMSIKVKPSREADNLQAIEIFTIPEEGLFTVIFSLHCMQVYIACISLP